MKNSFALTLVLLLILSNQKTFSQAPTTPLSNYFNDPYTSFQAAAELSYDKINQASPDDTSEGGLPNEFGKWEHFWRNRVAPDAPLTMSKQAPANTAYRFFLSQGHLTSTNAQSYNGDWNCIGPFNDYWGIKEFQGRIDQIWVNPNDTNVILAGSNGGGLWKTTDAGKNWNNITDNAGYNNLLIPGTLGVSSLAVDPINFDTIYIASQMFTLSVQSINSYGYGLGILYTHNGGNTWHNDTAYINIIGGLGRDDKGKVLKMMFIPQTEELIILFDGENGSRLFHKDLSVSPDSYFEFNIPSTGIVHFTDFEFSNQVNRKLVFSTQHGKLWTLDLNTSLWDTSFSSITVPAPYQLSATSITDISITSQDTAYALIPVNDTLNKKVKDLLYKTSINNSTWQLISDSLRAKSKIVEVSNSNPELLYLGTTFGSIFGGDLNVSANGGIDFLHAISSDIHADIRTIYSYSTTNDSFGINDVIYAGTDGGIVKKRAGTLDFKSITGKGLGVTQFYRLSSSESDNNIILGGSQDNAAMYFNKSLSNDWEKVSIGDVYEVILKRKTDKFGLISNNYPYISAVKLTDSNGTLLNPSLVTSEFVSTPYGSEVSPDPLCLSSFSACSQYIRPMKYSSSNTLYAGYRDVYRRINDSTWEPSFKNYPKDSIVSDPTLKYVLDIEMVEKDTNWVYMTYQKGDRLYYTTNAFDNAGPNPVKWKHITPPNEYFRIMDVTHDPLNPERIWVAYGDIDYDFIDSPSVHSGDTVMRVRYSPDTGNTWYNVSIGLPALPVNKIVYLEGSDDILFAATDVGVFKWKKDSYKWELYNEGMPPCIVLDLEINYCSGELLAATYGRGIWASPAFPDNYNPTFPITISTNTTWSTDKYLNNSVLIDSGVTLTIQGSGGDTPVVYMPRNAEILVKAGGKLLVNTARITNNCKDCFWDGVRVEGRPSYAQNSIFQGAAHFFNSTIENAKIAVTNYGNTDTPHHSTGGMIHAHNTTFLNNERAVELLSYKNHYGWTAYPKNYLANFYLCTFDLDQNYKKNINDFDTHVYLFDIDGPGFFGCTFHKPPGGNGFGIKAGVASGFKVLANCAVPSVPCSGYARNSFTGFKIGIDIHGLHYPEPVRIDASDFDSCSIGIRTYYKSHVTIANNTFKIGNGTPFVIGNDCENNIGIAAGRAFSSFFDNNVFQDVTTLSAPITYGVFYEDGLYKARALYKNQFYGLDYASVAEGDNSGFHFVCNTYDTNTYDILVTGTSTENVSYYQGRIDSAAGNLFLDNSSAHWTNSAFGQNHYYYKGANTQPNGSIFKQQSAHENACPSRFSTSDNGDISGWTIKIVDGGPNVPPIKTRFHSMMSNKDNSINTYTALIDGGDTDDLLNFINTSTINDTSSIRTTLLGYSPYLTIAVLTATSNLTFLDQNVLIDILEANPEMLRDENLLFHLENNIPSPLNAAQINDLILVSESPSARSEIEADIAYYTLQANELGNIILNHYLLDTTDWNKDSIAVWFDNMNTTTAQYEKAEYFTSILDYTTAQDILDSIPSKFNFDIDQQYVHDAYVDMWGILKNVRQDNRTIMHLSSSELDDLAELADDPELDGTTVQNAITQIFNEYNNTIPYHCLRPSDPPNLKPSKSRHDSHATKANNWRWNNYSESLNSTIIAYPNPASEKVTFRYKVASQTNNLILRLSNTTGQIVKEFKLSLGTGKVVWSTNTIPNGVYIYELKDNVKTIDVGKVIISK